LRPGDHELDAGEAPLAQAEEEVAPTRPALAVGQLDAEHLTAAVPIDTDGDQHRLAGDDAGLANLLVTRVQDQIGERLAQPAAGELGQALVELLVDGADR
jgi:hypothetical protein